ncbi:MAG: PAS domain S-box protein [Proteobacteria bacterium]|nr:PAS domain S-box protein [Pseudomonadota bacterium]
MKTLFEGKKLYAVIIAFLLIITFFITSHIIRNHYQYVFKNVIIENASTANLLSSLMYEHQKAATSILESYARRPLFIDAAKKKDFNHVIFHMKSLCEHRTEIDAPFIADKSGTVWANYPVSKESYGKNLAYRDWYKGVSRDWRPYISTVFRLIVLEKNLAVAIAVPVFDKKGKVIGILGTTQRTPFLANLIRANIIDPKKSIALLDQEGNIIFSNTVPYEENITKYPDARVREKAVAGVFIDMECADTHKKGSISYVSIAPVKGVGWLVIVGQDKNAILKSLYGYFILSAVTGFVIFLFLAVSLLYFRREYKYRKTKELLQAEEKYRNIFNDAILGIYQTTPEGRILSANPALVKMYGYDTPEEVINNVTATQMYVNPEDREIFKGILSKEGVVEKFEARFRKKGGEIIWVSINAHTVKDGQGNITHYEGTIEDTTERKQAEEAMKENDLKYRTLFENQLNGHAYCKIVVDENNRPVDYIFLEINSAFEEHTGLKQKDVLGRRITEIIPGVEKSAFDFIGVHGRVALTGKAARFEQYQEQLQRWYSVFVYSPKEGYFVSIFSDITERKRAEEKIKASLQEKELLLSEVHHRVKNNMQVISGLLDLQASSSKNPELTEMLNEGQRRIRAMAMIHEELYGSKDFTRIDLAGYVRTLSQELFQAYKINPGKIDLVIQTDGAVCVDISKAIPCGLILNELISNVFKHAFPGDTPGKLEIIIRETKNTEIDSQAQAPVIEIVVRDNGLGIPDDVDIHKPQTVGLHLVNGLVKHQLDGQIEVTRDAGTAFRITFPI